MGRAEAWGVGAAGVLLGAALAAAQTPDPLPRHEEWDPPAIAAYADEGNSDAPVDMGSYFDSGANKTYIYVAGVMSGLADGTVYTLVRYDEDDPDSNPKIAYYPPNHTTFTGVCTPTAMAVDVTTGDVYITGSTGTDPDRDYLTVKFKWDEDNEELVVDTGWGNGGAMTFDGQGEGNDDAVDVIVYDEGCMKRVIVTGTSDSGAQNGGDDITTVAYYPYTVTTQQCQQQICCPARQAGDEAWVGVYNGPGNDNDKAVEMAALRIAGAQGYTEGPVVVVAGTVWGGADSKYDLGAICYINDDSGQPSWDTTYDGPRHESEACTGIGYLPWAYGGAGTPSVAVICGSTPHYPSTSEDTDYILWAVNVHDGSDRWADEGDYGVGRAWTPTAADEGEDAASDLVLRQEGQELWAWVTGEAVIGTSRDVGTVAFIAVSATPGAEGDLAASNVFNLGDDVAVSIHQNTEGVFVTGRRQGVGYPSMFTLQYDGDATLTVTNIDEYEGDALAAGVKAICPGPTADLFATGTAFLFGTYSYDWVTFRYEP